MSRFEMTRRAFLAATATTAAVVGHGAGDITRDAGTAGAAVAAQTAEVVTVAARSIGAGATTGCIPVRATAGRAGAGSIVGPA